jgi:hypothetical protein
MTGRLLWPREHGAWAMLLLPFLSGLVVAGSARWESLAAGVTILGVFLALEPLTVLLRQRFQWRDRREASERAAGTLRIVLPPAVVAGLILVWRLPWRPLVVLAGVTAILMAWRIAFTLSNKQRFVVLQILEAAGLSATALLGYLSSRGDWSRAAFLLWGAFSLHQAAALFVIRARLEAIVGAKAGGSAPRRFRLTAWYAQAALGGIGIWALLAGYPRLALAFAVPFALHSRDLLLLGRPWFLKIPLTRVGWREVLISAAFAAILVSALPAG